MATLARDRRADERIDAFLAYCLREWEALPDVADEWAEWGDLERLEFATEWPIREDRLDQLRQWAEQELLTGPQREHYDRLLKGVAEHRPTLSRLLASYAA